MDSGWVEAVAAVLAFGATVTGGLIAYGGLKAKLDATIKRVDEHDAKIDKISALVTDVAVMKTELTHVTHDIRGINQAMETVKRYMIESRVSGS